jgi:hypothetical protein
MTSNLTRGGYPHGEVPGGVDCDPLRTRVGGGGQGGLGFDLAVTPA